MDEIIEKEREIEEEQEVMEGDGETEEEETGLPAEELQKKVEDFDDLQMIFCFSFS